MRMSDITKQWKQDNKEFIEKHRNDIVMLNMEFQVYVDYLCKDGIITEYQRVRAKNPFEKKRGR